MRLFVTLLILASVGVGMIPSLRADYPLTLEQRQRFKQYLPRTFPKLERHDPVHVVLLGDSVMSGYTPLADAWESGNPLFSYSGVFLDQLAREFFYTGGVRLLNPPSGGTTKRSEYGGNEITLENLTNTRGTILTGLRRAHSDLFLHDPDLVIIQYGIYDAIGRIPIDTYQLALEEIIAKCVEKRVDVAVFAPTLSNIGKGRVEWGIERPYAMAAEEVARRQGVLYIDAGEHLAKYGGSIDPDTENGAIADLLNDRLTEIYDFGPYLDSRERVHPSQRVNEFLGAAMYRDLIYGPQRSDFTYAGVAQFNADGTVTVALAIQNQTKEEKSGSVVPLAIGRGLIPKEPALRFTAKPNEITQVEFNYERPILGKLDDGADILYPLEPSDEFGRFCFLLEDTYRTEVVNLPVRVGPVTAVWKTRQYVNVTNQLQIDWDLVNGADKAVSGTFQVGLGSKIGEPSRFSIPPLGTKGIFSRIDFVPSEKDTFQESVWIQLNAGGKTVRFNREIEATRDLVLGEEVVLRSWKGYINAPPAVAGAARARREALGVKARFEADGDALYVIASLGDVEVPQMGEQAALKARLFLDARPSDQIGSFGAVNPVEIYTRGSDGQGTTAAIELGSFGNGYQMILEPQGITSVLTTLSSGERQLEIRVPRRYLHEHEWGLDSIESRLGVGLEITVADPHSQSGDVFPKERSLVIHSSTYAFGDRTIHGFHEEDARSLRILRLSRQPVESWSVRIY